MLLPQEGAIIQKSSSSMMYTVYRCHNHTLFKSSCNIVLMINFTRPNLASPNLQIQEMKHYIMEAAVMDKLQEGKK